MAKNQEKPRWGYGRVWRDWRRLDNKFRQRQDHLVALFKKLRRESEEKQTANQDK